MNTQKFTDYVFDKMEILSSDKSKPKSYINIISLPIKKIDNINVDVYFNYLQVKYIKLTIETHNGYYKDLEGGSESIELYCNGYNDFQDGIVEFNKENLKKIIDDMFNILNDLKFDKIQNKFCKKSEYGIFDFLKDLNNICIDDECCVCKDITTYNTHCKHPICIPCLVQLKPNASYEDEILCPICRSCIGIN